MLSLRLLGGMEVVHAGTRLPLPQSRKTRALLALLAMSDRPLRREKLCEMFWQVPDDPKGALRWSLSKIRALVTADGAARVQADRSEVRLDLGGLEVDARILAAAGAAPLEALPEDQLEELAGLCRGGFLDDLDLPDAFEFRAWRIAERESLRGIEVRLRRRLVALYAGREGAVAQAFRLVEIAPEQEAHHRALIGALEDAGRQREAEEQRRLSLAQLRDLGVEPGARLRPERRATAPAAAPRPPRRASPVPTVVVSGFRDAGADGGGIAEGLAEEVSRALARMPWILAVRDAAPGADTPDADYVLSGTLSRVGGRIRVSYRLLDRDTGQHVLSNRVEAADADPMAAQDELAGQIAAAMEPAILLAEIEALRRRPPAELGAHEHYLRGWSLAFGATGMDAPRAMGHFAAALQLDPEHAPSAIMLAWLGMLQTENLNPDGMRECSELARTALRFASNDGAIIAHAAYVLMFCERDWDTAQALADTAERLSPYSPQMWFSAGWVRLCCGDPRAALAAFDRSLGLTLTHPFAYIAQTGRANALLQAGEPAEAVAAARAAVSDNPTFHPGWRALAAALALAGDPERAAAAATRLRQLAPHESVAFARRWLPYRVPEQLDRLAEALAAAGLPED